MSLTVVLFSGHRIDEPDRAPARFPSECEGKARLEIRSALLGIAAQGPVFGMAGAADGGDILFHEVCEELSIASEICLALPPAEYACTSVKASWLERFQRLLETHSPVILEAGSTDVWLQDHAWQLRRAYDRHPDRTVLLALLETSEREIPGGTSGMVRMAQECGAEVIQLDISEICK